jgi:hypothetical protein
MPFKKIKIKLLEKKLGKKKIVLEILLAKKKDLLRIFTERKNKYRTMELLKLCKVMNQMKKLL